MTNLRANVSPSHSRQAESQMAMDWALIQEAEGRERSHTQHGAAFIVWAPTPPCEENTTRVRKIRLDKTWHILGLRPSQTITCL